MGAPAASFPLDWLERGDAHPASDLDLAVLLVNSHDLLEDPADRLRDLVWVTGALRRVGHRDLAASLTGSDLPRLRSLRRVLRVAFEAPDLKAVANVLNPQLVKARAVFLLDVPSRPGRAGARFVAAPDRTGMPRSRPDSQPPWPRMSPTTGSAGSASARATRAGARSWIGPGPARGATAAPSATTGTPRVRTADVGGTAESRTDSTPTASVRRPECEQLARRSAARCHDWRDERG